MAYKCVSKNGGDKKGPNVSCESDKPKEEKDRKKLKYSRKYEGTQLRTSEVYKTGSSTDGSSTEAGHKTQESNSRKALEDEKKGVPPLLQGITFSGDTKDYSGEDKTISLKSKDEVTDKEAIVKDDRFYKERGRLGKLFGKDYKQTGGILQTENNGKLTTVTYKGKGRKARVKEEDDKKINERDKDTYDKLKAEIEADEKKRENKPYDPGREWFIAGKYKTLNNLPYAKALIKEEKSDDGKVKSYKLATPYASDKELRLSKEAVKKELDKAKEGTIKMKRRILKQALKKGQYGKS